ncbi:MAG TPA: dienelactone hydrolase family protein [Alphaproteobacteria bacterium]
MSVRSSLKLVLLAATLLALLMLSARPRADDSDVARSWTGAMAFLPGDPNSMGVDKLPPDRRRPVVLYMHGCGGMNQENDIPWARYVASQGFIVVAPDRFARANKEPSCWPARNPAVMPMRLEELAYALAQIKASPWADPANVFVMGFSEGADAVGESRIGGIRGAIISSWTCQRVPDISLPAGIPVLSILWDDEHSLMRWLPRIKGTCGDKFESRNGFQNVALRGKGHNTYGESAARDAVAKFLRDNLTHKAAAR